MVHLLALGLQILVGQVLFVVHAAVDDTIGGELDDARGHRIDELQVVRGVTGTAAANELAEEADVVLAVGTRLQDFTTGSWRLFKNPGTSIIGQIGRAHV